MSGIPSESKDSGLSQHSPIPTLEDQYVQPIGQRVFLFIRANSKCCCDGGVEGILKQKKSGGLLGSQDLAKNLTADNNNVANTTPGILDGYPSLSDPFSFLYSGDSADPSAAGVLPVGDDDSSNHSSSSSIGKHGKTKKKVASSMTNFFKKVGKSTTQALERGMQELAIRTDPAGRGPDLYTLALYNSDDVLLSASDSVVPTKTDASPTTTMAASVDASANGGGVVGGNEISTLTEIVETVASPSSASSQSQSYLSFEVPLIVPPPNQSEQQNQNVVIKLWIKSQAFFKKQYLLGWVSLNIIQLRDLVAYQPSAPLSVTLTSPYFMDGKLDVMVSQDMKIPNQQRGWSLTDPKMSGYTTGLFNLPLDQSYNLKLPSSMLAGLNFPLQKSQFLQQDSSKWCIGTERAIESTIVLPVATALAKLYADASQVSCTHAIHVAKKLLADRHDAPQSTQKLNSQCDISLGLLQLDSHTINTQNGKVASATCVLSWQPADCIFEVELLQQTTIPIQPAEQQVQGSLALPNFSSVANLTFYPRVCTTNILPTILQAYGGKLPSSGFCMGNLKIQVTIRRFKNNHPSKPQMHPSSNGGGRGNANVTDSVELLESILVLETMANRHKQKGHGSGKIPVALYNAQTGMKMATLILNLEVNVNYQKEPSKAPNARNGLVSMMALDPLNVPDGCMPPLDSEFNGLSDERRQRQIQTLGSFVSHTYLDNHITSFRSRDTDMFFDRAYQYQRALTHAAEVASPRQNVGINNETATQQPNLEPHENKTPCAFRPSSSRSEVLLSSIPFNVHNASFCINTIGDIKNASPGASFSNITCGAPADHARGFGNVFLNYKGNPVLFNASGGLRRLEAKRIEMANQVHDAQSNLIAGVSNFFAAARAEGQKYLNHIPAKLLEIQALRYKVFETVQAYHHLTWHCAVRRANVFSQALCIALSSFLVSLSDPAKVQLGWPEMWAKHGYLVSFEGLLSAAGKELGMIEDASVAIEMLRRVEITLRPDNDPTANMTPTDNFAQNPFDAVVSSNSNSRTNADGGNDKTKKRVLIPHSNVLRWVQIHAIPNGSNTKFKVDIGIHAEFFNSSQRIPECLKNGASVSLYPLLFQVGVDIRQWGAHAGSNMKNQLKDYNNKDEDKSAEANAPQTPIGGLLDDEDDDVGVPDDDVLVALNYEAFQKMNVYAYAISPINYGGNSPQQQSPGNGNNISTVAHPSLTMLQSHIVTSAGKMNHSILDEAATIAQQLGGGGVVFCKSGKDRTAMHVTYKQAQFGNRFRQQLTQHIYNASGSKVGEFPADATLEDANTMRIHGTRLPICEKNVGQALYAFNSLQVKFMPDALKPPPNTLAGFLKGGRLLTGGGIET